MEGGLKAVIFDLDGTLVESAPAIRAVANGVMAEAGLAPLTLEETRAFIGEGIATFLRRALAARGHAADAQGFAALLARYHALYAAAEGGANPPFPGAAEALHAFAGAGLRLGLCTNKPGVPARAVLAALGWEGLFAAVVAGDTLRVLKPDPGPLLHAAALLGAAPAEVLYVGDSETDAAAAAAAGIPLALHLGGYAKGDPAAIPARFHFGEFGALVRAVLGRVA